MAAEVSNKPTSRDAAKAYLKSENFNSNKNVQNQRADKVFSDISIMEESGVDKSTTDALKTRQSTFLQKQLSEKFNFMEGLNPDNPDDYYNQLAKMSVGSLLLADTDSTDIVAAYTDSEDTTDYIDVVGFVQYLAGNKDMCDTFGIDQNRIGLDYSEYSAINNKTMQTAIDKATQFEESDTDEIRQTKERTREYLENQLQAFQETGVSLDEFEGLDSDGDGTLSADELSSLGQDDYLRYAQFDINEDGQISDTELNFGKNNYNGDGKVSFSELEFSMLDYNGDGRIMPQELMTLYQLADIGFSDDSIEDGAYTFGDIEDATIAMGIAKSDPQFKEFIDEYYDAFNSLA